MLIQNSSECCFYTRFLPAICLECLTFLYTLLFIRVQQGQDSSLDLFHAVGKVLFNKRESQTAVLARDISFTIMFLTLQAYFRRGRGLENSHGIRSRLCENPTSGNCSVQTSPISLL